MNKREIPRPSSGGAHWRGFVDGREHSRFPRRGRSVDVRGRRARASDADTAGGNRQRREEEEEAKVAVQTEAIYGVDVSAVGADADAIVAATIEAFVAAVEGDGAEGGAALTISVQIDNNDVSFGVEFSDAVLRVRRDASHMRGRFRSYF